MRVRALEVLFPPRCAGCDRGPWPFCEGCRGRLIVLAPPWCVRCGRPWPRERAACRDCPPAAVTSARAPFAFDGPARSAIHRLKFSGWRAVGEALAGAMVAAAPVPAVDAVTWVPLARRRRAERGFDQAQVLAGAVAALTGQRAVSLLRRTVTSGSQARRTGADRRAALRGAFRPVEAVAASSILLVDDVLTTGSTAAACAEALRSAGVERVHVLAAARSFALSGSAYTRSGPGPGLWLPGGTSPGSRRQPRAKRPT
jgi:ComF family protein